MGMFEKGLGKALGASWPAILVGAGAVIIAPKVISMGFRPLVKAGVRGFMDARDKVSAWATEAEASWRDLAAEVEAESVTTGAGGAAAVAAEEGGMRGVMRAAMRGMMNLRNKVMETTSEASEKWNDLVAEVKAEREAGMEEEEDEAGGVTAARAEVGEDEEAEEPPARTRGRGRRGANGSRTRTRGSRSNKA